MRPLAVLLAGFVIRAVIIATNPIVWGGDTMIRLFDRDTLVKAHQLPMLQVLIAGVSRISMNPALVQYMVALIGAVAGLGFYYVVQDLFGPNWAFPAAFLFVTHPYLLAISTVPFQEILMLAGLLFAFHFFYAERWWAASLCLAIACLTRYEAWAACPVLALTYILRRDRSVPGVLRAGFLFGWVPVAWILSRHGLTQTGHFAVEGIRSIWRFQRYVYLAWITVKFTQIPVLVLAAVGAWRLWKMAPDWRIRVQVGFVVLFAVAILFSAHGVMPDPERYVTSREACIPMCFVLIVAASGMPAPRMKSWAGWTPWLVALSVVLGIAQALWYVHGQSAQPDVRLDFDVAQFLDASVSPGQRALLLVPPLPDEQQSLYLEKVRATGGPDDLREAQKELAEMKAVPPDYQRVVVYSRLGRDRLLAPPATCADWVVVWDQYPGATHELEGAEPVRVLRSGPFSAAILRRSCGH